MASYFDLEPASKAAAASLDIPDEHPLKSTGMLTPQVSRILDDFDWGEHSGSDEDPDGERSLSEDSDPDSDILRKSQSSSTPQTKHVTVEPPPKLLGAAQRQKHPHLARFQSLRSILFRTRIEDEKMRHDEARAEAEAEEQWRAEHEQRKGLTRPKTPESPKGAPTKESFTHRMSDKLRRMTSKEPPTMKGITEENDNESTASSEDDEERLESLRTDHDSDAESINNSDVEDLLKWVGRRDPAGDSELQRTKPTNLDHVDSGQETLGQSDVDDLVAHANRKFSDPKSKAAAEKKHNYSDASTEDDSEAGIPRKNTLDDKEADELVRWISHKDGPNAGPVREQKVAHPTKLGSSNDNSDGPDVRRRVADGADTSGDSEFSADKSASPKSAPNPKQHKGKEGSLAPDDVDELVEWISRKDSKSIQAEISDEEPRGRSPIREDNAPMTHEIVDELTRTISRTEAKA